MSDWLKTVVKAVLTRLPRVRRPLERPVFVSSTRRSGSTLLMRMIYSQPGVNFVAQPLTLWYPHLWRWTIPWPEGRRYTTLAGDDERRLRRFLAKVLDGRVRFRSQWNLLDDDYAWEVRRLVVKDLNTKPLLCEIDDWFDLDVVFLLRHPVAVSRSVMEREWGNTAEVFLADQTYRERMLTDEQVEASRIALEEWGALEGFVAEWCLENVVPVRSMQDRDWTVLTYEELVARPHPVSEYLAGHLGLPDPNRMMQRISRPSKTTLNGSAREIRERGPSARATAWVEEVPETTSRRIQELFDVFGIEVYDARRPSPSPELLVTTDEILF